MQKALDDARFAHYPELVRHMNRLRAKFGTGVLTEIGNSNAETAQREMERSPLPKEQRNLTEVVRFFANLGNSVQYTWVERGARELKARVTRCRWAEELKKAGADSDLGYALVCSYDPGYCAGLNPAIKFSRTKTLMQGDDCCDHSYELVESTARPRAEQ